MAKYDLETRGPGDFFGEAQHGLPTLRVASLVEDTRTLTVAQQEAKTCWPPTPAWPRRSTVCWPTRSSACFPLPPAP